MNRKKVSQIGFFAAFAMTVASVIGIGIFLKNGTVFRQGDYNAINVLVSWVIATIACLVTALAYADISLSHMSKLGLAKWAESVGGKKLSKFIKQVYIYFYLAVLLPALAYFAAEVLLLFISSFGAEGSALKGLVSDGLGTRTSIGLTIGVGSGIYLTILLLNYISLKLSSVLQSFSLIIKFIPLIAVIIFGIAFAVANKGATNFFTLQEGDKVPTEATATVGALGFTPIILALPGILFAFDSFLSAGALAPNIRNNRKVLPRVIVVSMVIIALVYISITVSQLVIGQGVSWSVFNANNISNLFGVEPQKALEISGYITQAFYILILVSVIGVVNGFAAVATNVYAGAVEEDLVIGSHFYKKLTKGDIKKAGLILHTLFWFGFSVVYTAISVPLNTDMFIDGLTNFPTLFFFGIYGLLPILRLIQKVKNNEVKNFKFYRFAFYATVSFLLCWFIVGYQVFYTFLWDSLDKKYELLEKTLRWGGFLNTKTALPVYTMYGSIAFFVFLAYFFLIPFVNNALVSVINFYKKNPNTTPIEQVYQTRNTYETTNTYQTPSGDEKVVVTVKQEQYVFNDDDLSFRPYNRTV